MAIKVSSPVRPPVQPNKASAVPEGTRASSPTTQASAFESSPKRDYRALGGEGSPQAQAASEAVSARDLDRYEKAFARGYERGMAQAIEGKPMGAPRENMSPSQQAEYDGFKAGYEKVSNTRLQGYLQGVAAAREGKPLPAPDPNSSEPANMQWVRQAGVQEGYEFGLKEIAAKIEAQKEQARQAIVNTAYDFQANPPVNPNQPAWEAKQKGARNWDLYCLGFVNAVNKAAGNTDPALQATNAKASYNAMANAGRIRTDLSQMPAGSSVFWKSGAEGHIAVFTGKRTPDGDPIIITTGGFGRFTGIQEAPLSEVNAALGRSHDGYAPPPF